MTCPVCGDQTDDGLLCRTKCTQRLRQALRSLPELMRELRINYTRQSQSGTGNGGKSAVTPLMYDVNSSEVRYTVENTVGTWIRSLMEDYGEAMERRTLVCGGHACTVVVEFAAGPNITTWCEWLTARIHRIRGHVAVEQIYDELIYSVRLVRKAIDRPADREYLGTCDLCCSDLFAPAGTAEAGGEIHCAKCAEVAGPFGFVPIYDVADRRAWMLAKFREGLATAQEILTACPSMYGVQINSGTFYAWVSRGDLETAGHKPDGTALYSVDVALDLAAKAATRIRDRANRATRRYQTA